MKPTLLALLPLILAPLAGAAPQESGARRVLEWDARAVEHLFNRAGFGATSEEIEAALARRPEEVVEDLVTGGEPVEPFHVEGPEILGRIERRELTDDQMRRLRRALRRQDLEQMTAYTHWWIDAMASGADPLRDRMTLFWHGFFTSSYREVRRSDAIARQHRMLRSQSLGSYAVMLDGIVHDPAMLKYLDNESNTRRGNNENLARELLELFSLGEGNYTEEDVQEVARALTGMRYGPDGEYRFRRGAHDFGKKDVLGERGRLNGDDVVEILLDQEACARWVAGRIVEYLEGVWPSDDRLDVYAALLREANYEVEPMLRSLLLDPAFYRDEVVGTRVQGPVDYLVGVMRRLDAPLPAPFVDGACEELGQHLFHPPGVQGWEGGPTWITTSTLMMRGNVAGMALGVVDPSRDVSATERLGRFARLRERIADFAGREAEQGEAPEDSDESMDDVMGGDDTGGDDAMMDGSMGEDSANGESATDGDAMPRALLRLDEALGTAYRPRVNLSWRAERAGLRTDDAIARWLLEQGLAIEPPADLHPRLVDLLRSERAQLGLRDGELLESERAEHVLRRAMHWVLSLPAAQLS